MKLKKILLYATAMTLMAAAVEVSGASEDSDTQEVTEELTSETEEVPEELKEGWNYSTLYFSCPDFDIKGGIVSWNEETKEWNAEFSTPYMYTILGGVFKDDGTLELTKDNTNGIGEVYLAGLGEELQNLRNGLQYAYLAFSCPDFDITGGIMAWNEKTGEWKAEFPTPYMYTALGGTFTEDGVLELIDDNTGGPGEAYISGLEDAFAVILAGNRQAPLILASDDEEVPDGTISWNENEMTWEAAYAGNNFNGTYAANGTLTLSENSTENEDILPRIQEAFLSSLKGSYGNSEDAVVESLSELVASYPGNAEEYSFDDLTVMENSPLEGKKIGILGSSVAFGMASQEEAVGEYIAARFGAELTKETVSGTTLVDNGEDSYVERMINNMDPNADFALFICQLSTNDATKQLPLGEISDGVDGESFDTSTITGAMEYIIWYAKENWNCPIVFFTGSYYESNEYSAMVARLEELKDKWGIGVLNIWSDEDFNNISEEDRSLYMSDDVHPTKAGYKLWWGPEQEKQLLEYLQK